MYTFLCVDDNPEELSTAMTVLEEELDAHIITAQSYTAALELLNDNTIDAFIVDIELSEGRHTGIQLVDVIRDDPSHTKTPVVFVSIHSHFSGRLLTTVQNSAFLTKPVQPAELLSAVGALLGIPRYVKQLPSSPTLIIPVQPNKHIEIDPKNISYIELSHNMLTIQYIDGQALCTKCANGCLKSILEQIEMYPITHLRHVYRSLIINIDQIKKIEFNGNKGTIRLFGDTKPKPLGYKYREQLSELL